MEGGLVRQDCEGVFLFQSISQSVQECPRESKSVYARGLHSYCPAATTPHYLLVAKLPVIAHLPTFYVKDHVLAAILVSPWEP